MDKEKISEYMEAIREKAHKAAILINQEVTNKTPIILRHHADCDGYCGALTIEKALLPMITSQHQNAKSAYTHFKRLPMVSPYYDIADALRDANTMLEEKSKFGANLPLLIIIDNGSTRQDFESINYLYSNGAKIIVIDHHLPSLKTGTDAPAGIIDDFTLEHINPYLLGLDSNITAAMLCYEMSRRLSPEISKYVYLPSLSGLADKSEGPVFDYYKALAIKMGYNDELLAKLYMLIDFFAYNNRHTPNRHIISDLLGGSIEEQEKLISIFDDKISELLKDQLQILRDNHTKQVMDGYNLVMVNLDQTSFRGFPSSGKGVGMLFQYLNEIKKEKSLCIGYGTDRMTLRIPKDIDKTVQGLMKYITDNDRSTIIDGGGHSKAGTIFFASVYKERIMDLLNRYMAS
ncbi:hypothetical protein K9M79_01125 [Candidatus Woesearchaeota archaeon]|nr:hypothetical protein [Candidatus Woesearchaeota archaeon]